MINKQAPSTVGVAKFLRVNKTYALILTLICLMIYSSSISGDFLSADDIPSIVNNQELKSLTSVLSSVQTTNILRSLSIKVFGLNPAPLHILSIIFHIINALLVSVLTLNLLGKKSAFITGLIFATHPAATEAVAWISGFGYLVVSSISLTVLYLYVLYRKSGNSRYFYTALLVFVLGTFANRSPWVLVIPLTLVGIELAFSNTFTKNNNKYIRNGLLFGTATLALTLALFTNITKEKVYSLETNYDFKAEQQVPYLKRIPYSLSIQSITYLYPYKLSFFHEPIVEEKEYKLMVTYSLILPLAMVYLIYKHRRAGGLLLCIAFTLAPIFSPYQVGWLAADRYGYHGLAFFSMLFSITILGLDRILKTRKRLINKVLRIFTIHKKDLSKAGFLLGILVVGIYSAITFDRSRDYRSDKSLWLASLKTSPNSPRLYNNMGDIYSKEGNWAVAISSFEKAILLNPKYSAAYHNLGTTYLQINDTSKAEGYLKKSYELNPTLYQALEKLSYLFYLKGNTDESKYYAEKVLEINPQSKSARQMLEQLKERK